jgi:hypothetical protein
VQVLAPMQVMPGTGLMEMHKEWMGSIESEMEGQRVVPMMQHNYCMGCNCILGCKGSKFGLEAGGWED